MQEFIFFLFCVFRYSLIQLLFISEAFYFSYLVTIHWVSKCDKACRLVHERTRWFFATKNIYRSQNQSLYWRCPQCGPRPVSSEVPPYQPQSGVYLTNECKMGNTIVIDLGTKPPGSGQRLQNTMNVIHSSKQILHSFCFQSFLCSSSHIFLKKESVIFFA